MKRWTVEIVIEENAELRRTYAEARLNAGDQMRLRGVGTSWRNPRDQEVPEVGDELAAARALTDLAQKLKGSAAADVQDLADEASHGW